MKSEDRFSLDSEGFKNVIVTSIAGGSYGLLLGYGFEISIALGVVIGLLFGAGIGFHLTKRPPKMRYPMALFRRIILAATFLLLASFAYSYLLDQNISRTQGLWAAVLPLLGWGAVVISIGVAIASLDELQRRIQTEAIAIAFAVTAIFVGGYALFQFAGLGEVNVGLVLLVMAFAWVAGKLWTLWKYR